MGEENRRGRLPLLDVIRGATLISMMLYHFLWDLVYIAGLPFGWYRGTGAYIWQQSICWSFILLSGFCVPLSRRLWRRGLLVFFCGAVVSLVTVLFLYEDRVVFGVLTCIGSCMLIAALLRELPLRIPPAAGLAASLYLFFMTKGINSGYLTVLPGMRVILTRALYAGYVTTYLGFPHPGFYSTDYFSLLPWALLFSAGVFLHRVIGTERLFGLEACRFDIRPLSFLGRHSLLIYMLHQPVLYGITMVIMVLRGA